MGSPIQPSPRPDYFDVSSNSGKLVAAKYLRDVTGAYVINPNTNLPYVVPVQYNPADTISKYSAIRQRIDQSSVINPENASPTVLETFALVNGFRAAFPSNPDDLQRSYNGFKSTARGDFVEEFRDAASFNFGLACRAIEISQTFCLGGGGGQAIWSSLNSATYATGSISDFFNPSTNAASIRLGYSTTDLQAFSAPALQSSPILVANATVISPNGLNTPARNSANFITDNGINSHTATIGVGGTISDLWLLQKNSGNNFTLNEFGKAILASNPSITDINIVRPGQVIYIPQKLNDGSTTYNFAGGASVNQNTATGEYHMVVPNSGEQGGFTVYERRTDGDAGYVLRQTTTNAAGGVTFESVGYQETLASSVKNISVSAQNGAGVVLANTSSQIFDDGSSIATTTYPSGARTVLTTDTQGASRQVDSPNPGNPNLQTTTQRNPQGVVTGPSSAAAYIDTDPRSETFNQVVANVYTITTSNAAGVVTSVGTRTINPISGAALDVSWPVDANGGVLPGAAGLPSITSSGPNSPANTGNLSTSTQETAQRSASATLDVINLVRAYSANQPLPFVASGISLINNLTNGALPLPLTGVASAVGAFAGLSSINSALARGDGFGLALGLGNTFVAGVTTYAYAAGFPSVAAAVAGNAVSQGVGQAVSTATQYLPFANIVYSLINGDVGGAVGGAVSYFLFAAGPVGALAGLVVSQLINSFFGKNPPPPWGSAAAAWDHTANNGAGGIRLSTAGIGDGPTKAFNQLASLIAGTGYVIEQFNLTNSANPQNNPQILDTTQIGLVPQRLGSLGYAVNNGTVASSGGFQFTVSTINPATGADANPGLRFNTSGQVVSTYTGDSSYFQNLQTYYTTNALSRQAIAPLWEVDTARLQDKAHLSNSGLSELERAANLGHLAGAKPVPTAGTTERWNPIALNLGGNLTIKALTGSSVQFNVDGSAELDARLQGTQTKQYLHRTEWLNATDGFLVLDKNVNGTLDNAEELFSNSAVAEGYRGVASLATWDADGNGLINAADPIYAAMRIWRDVNGDGKQDGSEISTLADLGITSLDYKTGTFSQAGQTKQLSTLSVKAETVRGATHYEANNQSHYEVNSCLRPHRLGQGIRNYRRSHTAVSSYCCSRISN